MSYKLKFFYSARFMASSLSNLVNNIADGIHKTKYKNGHGNEKVKSAELNTRMI